MSTHDELVRLVAEAIDSNLGDLADVQTAAAAAVAAIEPQVIDPVSLIPWQVIAVNAEESQFKAEATVETLEAQCCSYHDLVEDLERRVSAARAEGWDACATFTYENDDLRSRMELESLRANNPYRTERNWPKEELKKAAEEWRAIPGSQKRHIPMPKKISDKSAKELADEAAWEDLTWG